MKGKKSIGVKSKSRKSSMKVLETSGARKKSSVKGRRSGGRSLSAR